MKEKIIAIITEYQNKIAEYFEMEIPMEHDSEHMEIFLDNLKAEITELFNEK